MYSRAHSGFIFCVGFKDYFEYTVEKIIKLGKIIYILFYIEYPQTYLETLHSHFQPACNFKMFKNSGSGCMEGMDEHSVSVQGMEMNGVDVHSTSVHGVCLWRGRAWRGHAWCNCALSGHLSHYNIKVLKVS